MVSGKMHTDVSETEIIVRYAETDRMGVVHHSNYPIWFEACRTDFIINKLNISYDELEKEGFLLPLTGLSCKFISPAKYGDIVIIRAKIQKAGVVRLTFSYEIINKTDGRLIATGMTEHAWTGRDFKPLNIKRKAPELFEALTQGCK